MTRAEYKALRSLARLAERRADLFELQASTWPHGDMSAANTATYAALCTSAVAAEQRVPGGLTKPFHCYHAPLLAEWIPRRNAVRNAVRLRHIAEREQALPAVVRRAA